MIDLKKRRIRQLISDVHKSKLVTPEKYQAIWDLYKMMYPEESKEYLKRDSQYNSKGERGYKVQEFERRFGLRTQMLNEATDYLQLKKAEPELVRNSSMTAIRKTASLPKEKRKKILKRLKQKNIKNSADAIQDLVRQEQRQIEFEESIDRGELKQTKKLGEEYKIDLCDALSDVRYILERFKKEEVLINLSDNQLFDLMTYLVSWTKSYFAPFSTKVMEQLKDRGKKYPQISIGFK